MVTENTLNRAYMNIEDGDIQAAIDILEMLISISPSNVEAWEAYMQICVTCEALDHVCERMLKITEISQIDRESALDYYYYLRQKIRPCNLGVESRSVVTFEMVNQFNYSLKEQPSIHLDYESDTKFKQGFIWFLGNIIVIPYIVLLVIGLNLLSVKNDFGYWILAVLALSVFVSMWKIDISTGEADKELPPRQFMRPSIRRDDISSQPELIS